VKVLFAMTTPYLPEETGGVASTTHELCRRLQARGDEVAVLAAFHGGGMLIRRRALARMLGGPRWFDTDRSLGYDVYRSRDPLACLPDLCARRAKPVVVAQNGAVSLLCRRAAEAGSASIAYIHDGSLADPGEVDGIPHPVVHVTPSEFMRARLRARVGVEPEVIPPLVDPDAYRTPTDRRNVLFVNPIPRKGLEIALALAARRPEIRFDFVEAWPLRHRVIRLLQARAAHHGNVRLLRRTDDMRPLYRAARIVLAPSLCDEAWGRVATEAHVNGIPVLASDSGALPEAVGPGGLIVGRDAPIGEWAAAFARLWGDQEEYGARSRAALEYSTRPAIQPETIVGRVSEVIARLGSSNAG